MKINIENHSRENSILHKASEHPIMEAAKENNGFVAGGAVRSIFASEKISDFDIFFPRKNDLENCLKQLTDYHFTQTDSAYSHCTDKKQMFQLICATFGRPEEIISKFDFTVCMSAWIPQHNTFCFDEYFMKHVAQKRLCFNVNADFPICSLWRVLKYTKKGYKLPAVEAIKLALRIHSIQINCHDDLKRQLMGIDTIFLQELTNQLGELNPETKYDFGEAIELIAKFVDEQENVGI